MRCHCQLEFFLKDPCKFPHKPPVYLEREGISREISTCTSCTRGEGRSKATVLLLP